MSKQLVKNYTFNSAAKTITLTDFTTVLLERLQLITDTTTNTILYNFADSTVSTATVAGNVITLSTVGTAGGTDKLMIIYDAAAGDPVYDAGETSTKLTDGTNTANVLKSDGTAAGQNAVMTAGSFREISGLTAGALNADLLPSTDVSAYKWISIQIATMAAGGTISFQGSNDNTVWQSIPLCRLSVVLSTPAISTTAADIYSGPVQFRYFRARQTAWTSGSTTGTLELYTQSGAAATIGGQVALNGTTSINTTSATGSAFPANAFAMGASDGTNLQPIRSNPNDSTTLGISAVNMMFNGASLDRTRAATAAAGTTGTGVPAAGVMGFDGTNYQRLKTDTAGIQYGLLTDGTTTTSVVAGDTGYNGMVTANGTKTYTFTTSIAGAQVLLADTKVEGYGTVEVVFTSVGAGLALTGQFSAVSGGTYVSQANFASGTSGFSGALGTTVNTIYTSPVKGNFFQLNLTALTSGTVTGTVTVRANTPQSSGVQAAQTGTWTVGANSATGSAVPANAFMMGVSDGTNLQAVRTGLGDGTSSALVSSGIWNYNGSSYDRQRGNFANIMLASAARTVTTASGDFTNWNHRGVRVTLNVTVASGTGGLQLQIQGKDSAISSAYYAINATPTAVIATGTYVYDLYPSSITVQGGITQVTNSILSKVFRANVIHGDASSYTYSISYDELV